MRIDHPELVGYSVPYCRARPYPFRFRQQVFAENSLYFYSFDNAPPTRSGISLFPTLPTLGLEVAS